VLASDSGGEGAGGADDEAEEPEDPLANLLIHPNAYLPAYTFVHPPPDPPSSLPTSIHMLHPRSNNPSQHASANFDVVGSEQQ
jgi:hypothetical protein